MAELLLRSLPGGGIQAERFYGADPFRRTAKGWQTLSLPPDEFGKTAAGQHPEKWLPKFLELLEAQHVCEETFFQVLEQVHIIGIPEESGTVSVTSRFSGEHPEAPIRIAWRGWEAADPAEQYLETFFASLCLPLSGEFLLLGEDHTGTELTAVLGRAGKSATEETTTSEAGEASGEYTIRMSRSGTVSRTAELVNQVLAAGESHLDELEWIVSMAHQSRASLEEALAALLYRYRDLHAARWIRSRYEGELFSSENGLKAVRAKVEEVPAE